MYILRIFKILRGCLFMKIMAKLFYRQKNSTSSNLIRNQRFHVISLQGYF